MIRRYDELALALAADTLRRGGLVAFPTETVYGLGARADDARAVASIYAAKGRPAENPSIVHTHDAPSAFALAASVPAAARALADRFWPGPLTLVMVAKPGAVASAVLAGGPTIALRVPSHPVAHAIVRAAALPIAAPSANRSTGISPTTAQHVEKSLGADLLIIDAGETGFGIESTIVDVTVSPALVLRRGSISVAEIDAVTPAVDAGGRIHAAGVPMRAPGTLARHYAPRTPTVLSSPGAWSLPGDPRMTGYLVRTALPVPAAAGRIERLADDPALYAHGLYAALHRLDEAGLAWIVIEPVPETAAWAAVADRVARATS